MRHARLACQVVAALLLLAMTSAAQEKKASTTTIGKEMSWLIFGNNEFAMDMYAKVAASEKGDFCFSPYSTIRSLALLHAGAKGYTADNIKSVMKLQLPPSELHASSLKLQKMIAQDAGPKATHLTGANGIWPRAGAIINANYLKTLRTNYGIEKILPLDFATKTTNAIERINNGVFLATDKIESIVTKENFDPKSEIIMTEAIYFVAPWRYRFVETSEEKPFTTAPQKVVKVPMMTQTARLSMGDFKKFDILELPMKSPKFVIQIILPKADKTLKDVEGDLAVYNFYEWGAGLKDTKVTVNLPRFDMVTALDTAVLLKALGLKDVFDPEKADLSNLTNKKYTLSHVYQKARFSFATTGARSPRGSLYRAKLPEAKFVADRPFVFIAKHKPTNTILLMGRVTNPAQK